jgi:acyl carrier protein
MEKITRKEERHVIESSKLNEFIDEIRSITSPKIFPRNYNHTIYFNNFEHEVPFEVSIKARRYSSSPFDVNLNLDDKWIFEIKRDTIVGNSRLREKKRKELSLREILEELSNTNKIEETPITSALGPYVADSYKRSHYVVKGEKDFRITVDDNCTYFFFEEGLNSNQIGKEDYARVEIKIPSDKINTTNAQRIQQILSNFEAEPIISKKDMAYNLLSRYLRDKYRRYVPSSDTEIEAKLVLDRKNQHLFHQIKKDFENGCIENFALMKEFPYVIETGELNHYVPGPKGDFLRISTKGRSKKITSKANLEIVSDPLGLDCIIKRKEEKEPFSESLHSMPVKTIYRKRKYFLVENDETKNSYCILMDRCTHENNELFQIEIEGLLLSPSSNEEKEIIQDISYIGKKIIEKYPVLKPVPMTKSDWLKTLI